MLVTDERGRYVGATETAVILTGYSVDELRGMPADVLFPNDSASNAQCRLQVLSLASTSLPATTVLQTKSAGPIGVHLTSVENLLVERQQ
jgi:PAS domain-containing protein